MPKSLLNTAALVYFFLKVLLNNRAGEKARLKVAKMLKDYLTITKDGETASKIASIMPVSFFEKMQLTYSRSDRVDEREMIKEFL